MVDIWSSEYLLPILERANEIASNSQLDDLLDRMMDLVIETCHGNAGTLYLLDRLANELVFKVVKGGEASQFLIGKRISVSQGIVGATLQEGKPLWVPDITKDARWYRDLSGSDPQNQPRSVLSFPLLLHNEPIGVVQVFDPDFPELQLAQLLGNRMASEIDKAMLLEASQQRSQRLQALVEIIGYMGSSLNRDDILRMIIDFACQLLNAEAGSLFLVDEDTGELVLHVANNLQERKLIGVRVPAGRGIIGYVVRTGETLLVADTSKDERHYSQVDQASGFETRSILATPLKVRMLVLGGERGVTQEHIIGGLEALNKLEGTFNQEDARLLETFANQAATVLEIARLYTNTSDLLIGVVQALTAAIDAKDPYTEGHSQRVSDFSLAIARELNIPSETLNHLRIAGLLHDVGKIGIPDSVLQKPGHLNDKEMAEMRKHPLIGEKIMTPVHILEHEMPAITEHHERVDGTGYPKGLSGEQITLIGRIVAVADVFDALTSDRPYRKGQEVKRVFHQLMKGIGTHFDADCVNALITAYQRGQVRTQKEREQQAIRGEIPSPPAATVPSEAQTQFH
jgi:HD-GYP domain-containing protein (c-di-GMP phosphodiesterase class II)